jgi:flavin reductase (DIM6/NTAB) family NADH-FMN oxidoreductase RutF
MTGRTSEALVTAFRGCIGEFATGVTVVTAEHEGLSAGMTLNSFTSVSLDPLLVLVSLGNGSRTLHATSSSGRFAVNILKRGQREVALAFSEPGAPFASEHVERDREGFLTISGAAAILRCHVERIEGAGDHRPWRRRAPDLPSRPVRGPRAGCRRAGGPPNRDRRGSRVVT